jgi:hypothetical protein
MPTRPTYRRNQSHGIDYAYTNANGRRISLGRYRTRESLDRFETVLAEWTAATVGREQPTDCILTVGELAERYLQHETGRRDADEVTRTTWYAARAAMLVLVESHAGSRGHPPTCCEISVGECPQSLPAGSVLHPAPQFACRW